MKRYKDSKSVYAAYGVDTEAALASLADITVSIHCWQGDDVGGFDSPDALSGGIQTTGNYPGKARTPDELMADIDKAFELIPGKKKLNLHASYAIFDGEKADRDAIKPEHFKKWVDFAKARGIGIDFNPTFFSHPMVKDNLTLSSPDEDVRRFWVEHGKRCVEISEYFANETPIRNQRVCRFPLKSFDCHKSSSWAANQFQTDYNYYDILIYHSKGSNSVTAEDSDPYIQSDKQ